MAVSARVETWRFYARMVAVPVTIYAPDTVFADVDEPFTMFVAIRYEKRPVTDAIVTAKLITPSGIVETVDGVHISDGIYAFAFSDKTTKHGIIHVEVTNYYGEAFVQLSRSVVKPISLISKKILSNNWEIKNNQLIIYDDDGITPILKFNLYDKLGRPTEMNVFKRERVEE